MHQPWETHGKKGEEHANQQGRGSPTAEANNFCSISSAQGVDASLSFSTVVGNMPKNCTGSHSGQLHCLHSNMHAYTLYGDLSYLYLYCLFQDGARLTPMHADGK